MVPDITYILVTAAAVLGAFMVKKRWSAMMILIWGLATIFVLAYFDVFGN